MSFKRYASGIFLLFLLMTSVQAATSETLRETLRAKVEWMQQAEGSGVSGEYVSASIALPAFYQKRNFEPAWVSSTAISGQALLLLQDLEQMGRHGLKPEDYHVDKLRALQRQLKAMPLGGEQFERQLVDFDLLLTDAYLLCASHLHIGKVNPETSSPEWKAQKRTATVAFDVYLEQALTSEDLVRSLDQLAPEQAEYQYLRKALIVLNSIREKGGWGLVEEGEKLEEGMDNPRVEQLRYRLEKGHYLQPKDSGRTYFDAALKAAVRTFQLHYGLADDGVVGTGTVRAMNMTVEQRIEQVVVNMERWRWLPASLGEKHIRVNIADFRMEVYEHDKLAYAARAIVGKPFRKTPVFSATLTYIVFNPYWTVPPVILKNDVLPAVRKDVGYLATKRMKVLDQGGNEVDPATIDWQNINPWKYTFRQEPGRDNSLGLVKFMFPNNYDVYMHDTPSKELFTRSERAFSSGCVRLQNPLDLAAYLLKGQDDWNREKIAKLTAPGGTPYTVVLKKPLPVHLLYLTAWGEEDGTIQFRKDVYSRDKAIARALGAEAPEL